MKQDMLFEQDKPDGRDKADDRVGHRARLRERLLTGGAKALADYELVELLLCLSIPRKDVKPLAKELLKKFGGFSQLMAAPVEQLCQVKGISRTSAAALKIVEAASHLSLQQNIMGQPVLSSWQNLLDYCTATMGSQSVEQFRLLFLDKKNRLIADEVQQTGTIDHTPVYPREIIKRALDHHATAIILVHNHPSGDATPSQSDIDMTRAIVQAAKSIDITVHDHVIITRNSHTSFRSLGLL